MDANTRTVILPGAEHNPPGPWDIEWPARVWEVRFPDFRVWLRPRDEADAARVRPAVETAAEAIAVAERYRALAATIHTSAAVAPPEVYLGMGVGGVR